ncbi:MAG: RNA polymerase ECF-type sigma factor [Anaerolinea thermophila]|uniref:RNA polymerase ECF-type sigma factor n=1 Tax=Anaerolinea thermophila TaxID=167964 RepID=A0A101FYX1_9CHLR|nr:MAG: RNA polymerase ECF-type sigma factor [Anaerolinea thermophila]
MDTGFVEADCIKQVLDGDDDAFTDIVEHYQSHVYNLCYRMLGIPQEAEDAAQECFIRAYRYIKRYDQSRPFATWLLSIAAHYCIDQQRKRHLLAIDLDEIIEFGIMDDSPDPEKLITNNEKSDMVQKHLAELPAKDRMVLILRYWYEFSENEISEALDISTSAVKSRLHRARQHMAEQWNTEEISMSTKEGSQHEPQAI